MLPHSARTCVCSTTHIYFVDCKCQWALGWWYLLCAKAGEKIHTCCQSVMGLWWQTGQMPLCSPTYMANSNLLEPILKPSKVSSCLCSWVRSGLSFLSSDVSSTTSPMSSLKCLRETTTFCIFCTLSKQIEEFGGENHALPPPALVQLPEPPLKTCFKMQNWASLARLLLCPYSDTPSKWRDCPNASCLSLPCWLCFCSPTHLPKALFPENSFRCFEKSCTFLPANWWLTGF